MIQPTLFTTGGINAALFSQLVDLDRRLSGIEAARGFLNGIDGSAIAAGTIPGSSIAAGSISATQITAGGITTAALAAGSVTAAIIQAGAVNASHIQANSITANELAANSVTASEIAANTITTTHMTAASVTTTVLAAGSVTTDRLAAGAVTSDKITVSTLSAITSNIGSVTSGTIQGATIQTASSGSRVVIDSLGIRGYALNGTTKVFEVATGSGIASFTGIANIDPTSVIPGGTITTNTLPGDRIVTGSIQTLQIAAGAITANTIAAGAITAQKLSIAFGGANLLQNSDFSYYTGVITETAATSLVNLATNPSAEAGIAGWTNVHTLFLVTGAAVTQDFTQAYSGAASVKVVTTTTAATGGGIPIPGVFVSGVAYNISFYIKGAAGGETVTAFLGSPTGVTNYGNTVPTVTTAWTRVTVNWTPNVTVSDVFFSIRSNSTTARTFFVDGLMCVQGAVVPAYFDGSTDPLANWDGTPHASTSRLNSIVGDPGVASGRLINRVGNPSIEVDTAGWSTTGGSLVAGGTISRVTSSATRGSASLQIVTTATNSQGAHYAMGVLPAGTYAWSLDVKSNTAGSSLSVYAGPFSGTGGTTTAITAGTAFARFSGTFTANGTENQVIAVKVATAAARTLTVDAVSVVLAGIAPDYFDGSTAGGAWEGTAHASMSWLPDSPGYWTHYDNGGTGAGVWQKVPGGGPNGENSWKVTYAGTNAQKGYQSSVQYPARPLTSYVLSFYWKSSVLPSVISNHSFDLDSTWLLQPTPSASVWQRYAVRLKSTAGGASNLDWIYIYGALGTGVTELSDVQYEEGETLTPWAALTNELLPYSVGNTVLTPNSVTTDKILAGTIQGGDISASTITGTNIAASTITAANINVSQLSAIAADMGTVTAGTITGATIRTAATGGRVQLDVTGFKQYAADGTTVLIDFPATGGQATFTGFLSAKGITLQASGGASPATVSRLWWTNGTKTALLFGDVDLSNRAGLYCATQLTSGDPIQGYCILRDDGVSGFMKARVPSSLSMDWGTGTVGPNTSVTVATNLFTPTIVVATPWAVGLPGSCQALNHDIPAVFQIRIYNNNAFTVSFTWIAIG